MAASGNALTPRAARIAQEHQLGDWLETARVNTDREPQELPTGAFLLAGSLALLVVALLLGRDHRWAGLLTAVIALGMLPLALHLCRRGIRLLRTGRLLLHRFEHGFIVERTRRGVLSGRHDATAAELSGHLEARDGVSHLLLRLSVPGHPPLSITEPKSGSADTLWQLARSCASCRVVRATRAEALRQLAAESWL